MIHQISYKCFTLKNIAAERFQACLVVPLQKSLAKKALRKTYIQNFLRKGSDSQNYFCLLPDSYSFWQCFHLLPLSEGISACWVIYASHLMTTHDFGPKKYHLILLRTTICTCNQIPIEKSVKGILFHSPITDPHQSYSHNPGDPRG